MEPHMFIPNRLEVLAAIYEHLDTAMNSVLVLDYLKFEFRDVLRVPNTLDAGLRLQQPRMQWMVSFIQGLTNSGEPG
jgi:hypothetical protein